MQLPAVRTLSFNNLRFTRNNLINIYFDFVEWPQMYPKFPARGLVVGTNCILQNMLKNVCLVFEMAAERVPLVMELVLP